MNESTADRLMPGCAGRIIKLSVEGPLRQRLYELGLIPGALLRRRCTAPAGSPIAYEVGGALLAIRKHDASRIVIREDCEPWTV